MKKIIVALLILASVSIFTIFKICEYAVAQEHKHSHKSPVTSHQKKATYYCPMHPTYTSDKPGDCPICNMKLVKAETDDEEKPAPKIEIATSGYTTVKITPERQQMIGIKTEKATREQVKKIIRTVGRVAYHPELVVAQEEYLQAKATLKKVSGSPIKETPAYAESLVKAAKDKLRLLGMSDAQVQELEATGVSQRELYLPEPDGDVWLYATIYEYEIGLVKEGDIVRAEAVGVPEEKFEGAITSIEPVLDAQTRSLNVRASVKNKDGKLKPQMFANVEIEIDLGEQLTIPEDAILDSGTRKIVFVDIGEGYFEPREVKAGAKSDGKFIILDGLKEGEPVVAQGNFLVDSESKLKAALAGMGAGGHKHGQ